MEKLPVEVLECIFSYLSVGDIISCIKVCRRWNEILSGHGSLLSGKDCVLKCSGKMAKAKNVWRMIAARQPISVVLRNADPVNLQLLYKHHPRLIALTVQTIPKHLKKVLRTVYLLKCLVKLTLQVKGGEELTNFSLEWVHGLPELSRLSVIGVGSISDDALPSHLNYFTLKKSAVVPALPNTVAYVSHLEIGGVTDEIMTRLAGSLHDIKVCVLTGCRCSTIQFPISLITSLKIQGNVATSIALDNLVNLQKVHFSLNTYLPECMLPNTVTELSVRGCVCTDPHWFLGLSIACANLTKLDLKGHTLKPSIASSLGSRFPKLTHLNLLGCIGKHVDHVYMLAILQESRSLNTLLVDAPYSCTLEDIRQLFPHVYISNIDYRFVNINVNTDVNFYQDIVLQRLCSV